MRRIILLCLCMLLLPTLAQASSYGTENKLLSLVCSEIKADAANPAGLRLEFGLSREAVDYRIISNEAGNGALTIEVANSRIKNLKRNVKLDNQLVKNIHLVRVNRASQITINTTKHLSSDNYKIYTAPLDMAAKKPARLIIELYNDSINYYAPGLKGKRIVLDAGHGGSDSGAVGPGGLQEKTVTFAVTNSLADMLRQAGVTVAMTRESDIDVYGPAATDVQELQARVNVAENNGADAFISIHANSFTSPAANGTATYYYAKTSADARLAQSLQKGMINEVGLRDRGIEAANFYVLKRSSMPASLVELAFISNYNEEAMLENSEWQNKFAEGIYEGLVEYFK